MRRQLVAVGMLAGGLVLTMPASPAGAIPIFPGSPGNLQVTFDNTGAPGFNFAFIGRPELYHSPLATPDALDRGALQDLGRQALDLTRALADAPSLDALGTGNRRSVRWNLLKLVGEYARHNGHADILREQLDGTTGE